MSSQTGVRATYMRGGTSKGVFFTPDDLPAAVRDDAAARDAFLLRVTGSPDPYRQQIDGMGGGTSSTSKVVIVSHSRRADCDVDYWFGAVSIDAPLIDGSGNCGNLTAAVGPFAIRRGLVQAPADGVATVRIWQANIGKRIVAQVPMQGGEVVETGDFELDGVTFPAAEIRLEFLDPAGDGGEEGGALFPSGRPTQALEVPGLGTIEATLINAGNPTVFVHAEALGLTGRELQADVNLDVALLARLEAVRAHGAVAMGLAASVEEATRSRPATPKIAFVAPPAAYVASSGKAIAAADVDLLVRIVSMGRLHHAITGTGAVALAVAAATPGTVASAVSASRDGTSTRIGHPSGVLRVGAEVHASGEGWEVARVVLSRTARRLMEGLVFVPSDLTGRTDSC